MTTVQAPGHHGTTQETSRVLKRGQLEFLVFKFFYDQNGTQPVIPLDSQQYPNYRVLAPGGEILHQGVAVPGPIPGIWQVGWVVPKNAELTNVHKRYKFQTVMVDNQLRQFEVSFEFDVVETAVPAQSPELQQLVTFVGEPLRIKFVNTTRPDMLRMRLTPRGADTSILHYATWNYPVPAVPGPNDLLEVEIGNSFVYYTETPPFVAPGEYSAVWTVRDSALSTQESEHNSVEVITTSTMFLVKRLRMLVDKLQKKLGIVYAYPVEDLVEYLRGGMAEVNKTVPPSAFTLDSFPPALESYVILAAAWWALTAQRIAYAETNFDFGGQTVTLGYNPGADIEGTISTFREILNTELPKTKTSLFRASSSVGHIATRPSRFNRGGMVFKTHNYTGGSNSALFNTLAQYGLFLDF